MTRIKSFTLALALGLTVTVAAPALGQVDDDPPGGSADPEFDGDAGAIIINGLTVVRRQDLWFGTIAPSLTEAGTVKVNRGRNYDSVCEPTLTCFAPGNRARFTITGEPRALVNIDVQDSITIYGPGDASMLVDTFVGAGSANNTQWRGWQRLRWSGISRFNVGATLHVNPNQAPGRYTGHFTITVSYQ